jgi:hypothetical protein
MMNDMMDMKGNLVNVGGMEMKNQIIDMNTVMYPEVAGEELRNAKKVQRMEKNRAGSKQTTAITINGESVANKSMDHSGHKMAGMIWVQLTLILSHLITRCYGHLKKPLYQKVRGER